MARPGVARSIRHRPQRAGRVVLASYRPGETPPHTIDRRSPRHAIAGSAKKVPADYDRPKPKAMLPRRILPGRFRRSPTILNYWVLRHRWPCINSRTTPGGTWNDADETTPAFANPNVRRQFGPIQHYGAAYGGTVFYHHRHATPVAGEKNPYLKPDTKSRR